ncbi:uncharacterized protein PFL1_06500 [Pseudozyma flocculosa PF-1]|uniref:Uncharacterized protein n=1 Tax=Pseudozyma flocculosa PF-1 TaxID=1277687 RepID=A0A061H0W8_9BASI|nr:uncharacterized protein PFL1_06500 [Pseudozyma flocculosa PF-1]EPQ26047.1 hypothetical protein PFL1_06500 [Pseudozyma flocculosa PF-1]
MASSSPTSRSMVPRTAPASATQDPRLSSPQWSSRPPPSAPTSPRAQRDSSCDALVTALSAIPSVQYRLQQLEQGMIMSQHILSQHDIALNEHRASTEQARDLSSDQGASRSSFDSQQQVLESKAESYRQELDAKIESRLKAFDGKIEKLRQHFEALVESRLKQQAEVYDAQIQELARENAELTKLLDQYRHMFQESERHSSDRATQLEHAIREAHEQSRGSVAIRVEGMGAVKVCNAGETVPPVETKLAPDASMQLDRAAGSKSLTRLTRADASSTSHGDKPTASSTFGRAEETTRNARPAATSTSNGSRAGRGSPQPRGIEELNADGDADSRRHQRPRTASTGSVVCVGAEMQSATGAADEEVTSRAVRPASLTISAAGEPVKLTASKQQREASALSKSSKLEKESLQNAASRLRSPEDTRASSPSTSQVVADPYLDDHSAADRASHDSERHAAAHRQIPRRPADRDLELYRPLIAELLYLRTRGSFEPARYHVATSLAMADPMVYARAHALRWADYAADAARAGIVRLGMKTVKGTWVMLSEWFDTIEGIVWSRPIIFENRRGREAARHGSAATGYERPAAGGAGDSERSSDRGVMIYRAALRVSSRDNRYYPVFICDSPACPRSFISRRYADNLLAMQKKLGTDSCKIIPPDPSTGQQETFCANVLVPYAGHEGFNKKLYDRDGAHLPLRGAEFLVVESIRSMPGFEDNIEACLVICRDILERYNLVIRSLPEGKAALVDVTRQGLLTLIKPVVQLSVPPCARVGESPGRKRKSPSYEEASQGFKSNAGKGSSEHAPSVGPASRWSKSPIERGESPVGKRTCLSTEPAIDATFVSERRSGDATGAAAAGAALPAVYGDLDEEQRRQCHTKTRAVRDEMEEARRRSRESSSHESPRKATGIDRNGFVRDFDEETPRHFTIRGTGSGNVCARAEPAERAPERQISVSLPDSSSSSRQDDAHDHSAYGHSGAVQD